MFPFIERGGHEIIYPVLRGRGQQNVSDPRFSYFVALPPPPLPVINDQSLTCRCLQVLVTGLQT